MFIEKEIIRRVFSLFLSIVVIHNTLLIFVDLNVS